MMKTTLLHQSLLLLMLFYSFFFLSVVLGDGAFTTDKVQPAYDLLNRVLNYNQSREHFSLILLKSLDQTSNDNFNNHNNNDAGTIPCQLPCFVIDSVSLNSNNMVRIRGGPTLSEITAGIGWYFRNIVNATSLDIWPPMNITNIYSSTTGGWSSTSFKDTDIAWPVPVPAGRMVIQERNVPYSYLMNVCTHSYSLVWYSAADWIRFIDWMALSGINMVLALTGQEWIQYKVFKEFGLSDDDIRHWFNGPAFLTWSRGQNEYGNNIAGPLPISWMKSQWELQRSTILPRLRELDMIGILPAFQGNVPIQLKDIYMDSNITQQGDTGWMDSLDPLYRVIAKKWMETLIQDFGTDHWYQVDGYFNGGTAPWFENDIGGSRDKDNVGDVVDHDMAYSTSHKAPFSLDSTPLFDRDHDDLWYRRGVAVFEGLNETDPDAIWCFQGFAFVDWDNAKQASHLRGFVDSVPVKKDFVIMDMSYDPDQAEWKKWNHSAFFGASFVWTVLHNFGGTDGIKGDLRKVNRMPFDALNDKDNNNKNGGSGGDGVRHDNIIGLGATPEGITQNPAFYGFLYEQPFQNGPVKLIPHMVSKMHRRYGLNIANDYNEDISMSWQLLLNSLYSTDRSVQDGTGVAQLLSKDGSSLFEANRHTPSPTMCLIYHAWTHLLKAAIDSKEQELELHNSQSFQYDLVNLGREVLAQLATPMSLNFTEALSRSVLDESEISTTSALYEALLLDLDTLVATEETFLLGRWLASAQRFGENSTDCEFPITIQNIGTRAGHAMNRIGKILCEAFYEWNARVQVTTWNPTLRDSPKVPGGPIDYAAKHWSGLILDYYMKRVQLITDQALQDASNHQPLNQSKVDKILAQHAYQWTTASVSSNSGAYPTTVTGDFITVSKQTHDKYREWFWTCSASSSFLEIENDSQAQ